MLKSVDMVIDLLGGTLAVAELAGVDKSSVSCWRARGYIPPRHVFLIEDELGKRSTTADPRVFRKPIEKARP